MHTKCFSVLLFTTELVRKIIKVLRDNLEIFFHIYERQIIYAMTSLIRF